MIPKPTHLAAFLAAGAVALTGAFAWIESPPRPADDGRPPKRPAYQPAREPDAVPEAGRQCAIYHARFGGLRARLVKVRRGEVVNYVVIETPRRNPMMASVQRNWLRGAYGEAEPAHIGEYSSVDAALAKAVLLCPADLRCRHGEPGCGPDLRPFTAARAL